FLPARLARHGIVDPNHVVAEFSEQRTVALVGAWWNAILPRSNDPTHLVVVRSLATRTGQLIGACLVAVVEEIAFVQRHAAIILSFDNGDRRDDRPDPALSQRPARARPS